MYGASIGWISLGDGMPTNGSQYSNLSADDFGVNVDGSGNLRGFAYGASIGWISLSNVFAYVQTENLSCDSIIVINTTPDNGMVDLSAGSTIVVEFDGEVDAASVSSANFFVQGDEHGIYTGSFTVVSKRNMPLRPIRSLTTTGRRVQRQRSGIGLGLQRGRRAGRPRRGGGQAG